jgi:N-acetylneuraminic acid mutarotase
MIKSICGLSVLLVCLMPAETARAQAFTLDTPLLTARWGHAATLLTNGLLLIAGGRIANDYTTSQFANTNNCELYNPVTGSSTLTGPMNDSHFAGAAMLLTNGQVLIVGGENNGQYPITGAELYDTSSGTWTSTGSLQQERTAFSATLLPDGRVLVVGGYDGGGAGELASAEIYAPNTGKWSNAAAMTYSNDTETATLLPNGKVLVAGGSYNGIPLTNAILYNPANNTWTNTGGMNVARAGHAATLLPNGKVLVVGGEYSGSAEVYDPSVGTWSLVASMNNGRSYPSATLLPNGQVLVLGGDPGQTSAELYNPTNNIWTVTGSLNVGRIAHTATLVSYGQVVVAGGDVSYYNGPPMPDVETFNQSAVFGPYSYALNTTGLAWNSSGDTTWLVETTNTYDGVAAAQSGSVTNSQASTLTLTVTGPGTLTFYWSSIANDTNQAFYFEFDIDGVRQDSISGNTAWYQDGPFNIGPGQHTLTWTAYANGDTDPTQAAFLDQVSYSPPSIPPTPGMWTLTGSLTNALSLHTATLLPNGRVLVAGGSDNSGNAFAAAQLYNPATGTWTGTNAMAKARYAHTATLLPNGKVLVAGGTTNQYDPTSASLVQPAELFNPTNDTWTTTGALNFPRFFHTATLLANGKVLVTGGMNADTFPTTILNSSELYDPATGLWTTTGPLQVARYNHTATLLPSGQVLVAGGQVTNSLLVTAAAELYDPVAGTWTATNSMPNPLANHTAALLPNGQVLVAGGDIDIGSIGGISLVPVPYAYLYNPGTGLWTTTTSMHFVHDYHTATLLTNGVVLIAGGGSNFGSTTNCAELYEPFSQTWTAAATMNAPRQHHTATLLPNGRVLAAGGSGNSGLLASAELYNSIATAVIKITNPTRLPGGAFQFGFNNTPGVSFTALATTNLSLSLSNWSVLGSVPEISPGMFQITDPQATNNAKRFYRVRSP